MKFSEIVNQAATLLQDSGRISYRALKREFDLDDETLDDLKEELIDIRELATDKDGKMLVWAGGTDASVETPAPTASASSVQAPIETNRQPLPVEQLAPEGERRQLTVMFCDLVGSTALSEQLDPEDLHAIVRAYQDACRQVIERYEGYIAQYLGDGILVYFGYPAAHEDDAVRGVRAGLDILAALPTLELAQPVQARIGIHTGPVVIGTVGGGEHTEQLALGETPNIAARVQGKAEPDTVAISADTYHLVQGFIACEDLGLQELKGLSAPLRLYQVTGEGEAQNRFDVSVQQGLTPLVGREEELELLHRRWERAKAGQGQVVLLSGEAGIGKSRLVQVLRDHSQDEPHLSILYRCSPFYQNSVLYPIIDGIQNFLQFAKDDTPAAKLTKLTQALEPLGMNDGETRALFATLLSIPLPDDHPPLSYSPQKQKEKTLQVLVTGLHKAAEQQPVRMEFEDLHWADASTLELLSLLIDEVASSKMLLLLTFRPEFSPPWLAQAHTLQLHLNRLPQQDIVAMVARVAGKVLPDEVVQQLLSKSDGVPLYIEEMTKNLLESELLTETDGHYELIGPLHELTIPSSLQDSFAARLDRLAPVRELAQIGAVLGREFTYDLIHAVSQMDDAKLRDGLQQLSQAEILFQRGAPPDATYTFKHALLQDAAYASLLLSRRQQLHQQTAQVVVEHFAETVETQPELVAHHYTEAGLLEEAVTYWQKAGERAAQRSANMEAINHLTTGLNLLETLPDTPRRAQQELAMLIAVGAPLQAIKGWTAAEVRKVYTRARELCQQLGETSQVFPMLFGVWVSHYTRAELQTAKELGEQLITLGQRLQDPGLQVEAHHAQWSVLLNLGELSRAREHAEQGFALYNPQQHRSLAFVYGGHDAGSCALNFGSTALWLLGYPDQARKRSDEALALVRESKHPLSLALSLYFAARLHQLCREDQVAHELAQEGIVLSDGRGFSLTLEWARIMEGWTLAERGQAEDGIAYIRQGDVASRVSGAQMGRSHHLALLAHGCGKAQQPEEGLSVIAEAQEFVVQTGETFYEAELYRLKGELGLQKFKACPEPSRRIQGSKPVLSDVEGFNGEEAEDCFQKALDISRSQQAKSLELRAATSLARLWQQQGKRTEARELLAPVYGWFTEGFDTKDLQEAKALLDELSEAR